MRLQMSRFVGCTIVLCIPHCLNSIVHPTKSDMLCSSHEQRIHTSAQYQSALSLTASNYTTSPPFHARKRVAWTNGACRQAPPIQPPPPPRRQIVVGGRRGRGRAACVSRRRTTHGGGGGGGGGGALVSGGRRCRRLGHPLAGGPGVGPAARRGRDVPTRAAPCRAAPRPTRRRAACTAAPGQQPPRRSPSAGSVGWRRRGWRQTPRAPWGHVGDGVGEGAGGCGAAWRISLPRGVAAACWCPTGCRRRAYGARR